MELSGHEEGEIAIPINISSSTAGTTYGGGHHGNGHGHGHLNIIHDHDDNSPPPSQHHSHSHMMMGSSAAAAAQLNQLQQGGHKKQDEKVRYRECLKNHAAAMGGNATDGCGEFMASGEEGSIEALNCSACHCHRNFHRREVEGDPTATSFDYPPLSSPHYYFSSRRRKFLMGGAHPLHKPNNMLSASAPAPALPSRAVPPHHHHQMIMPYSIGSLSLPSESDEHGQQVVAKKRFRTKFTQEQKEKMLGFAEKVGWKIQKQEESVVQQFCQEIGVKRRVLKVWMHNNKHNLAAKSNINNPPPPINPTA